MCLFIQLGFSVGHRLMGAREAAELALSLMMVDALIGCWDQSVSGICFAHALLL